MPSGNQLYCPNFKTCLLVNSSDVVKEENKKNMYIAAYCMSDENEWSNCKRYITKKELNFCPDFVLPDSPGSPSDFITEFDKNVNF